MDIDIWGCALDETDKYEDKDMADMKVYKYRGDFVRDLNKNSSKMNQNYTLQNIDGLYDSIVDLDIESGDRDE